MPRKAAAQNLPLPDEPRPRDAVLDKALGEITKKFGDGAVMRLGEASHLVVEPIPTGSLSLDLALGVGGIPRGRVTEIYGPESSGKTTLCQHIVAEAQRRGGVCAYVDMEHALDPAYAEKCGVEVENQYISQPDTGEQALEIAETLVGNREPAGECGERSCEGRGGLPGRAAPGRGAGDRGRHGTGAARPPGLQQRRARGARHSGHRRSVSS